MTPAPLLLALALAAAPPDDAPAVRPGSDEEGAVQDLLLLADDRPVFLRLRIASGGRPFRAAWADSVRALHASLDRDGDGTLTAREADRATLDALVRLATGGAAALPRGEPDARPKDGIVTPDELADFLRPALGPFRVEVGRLATTRTDALFGHLDRDKDGQLTEPELAAIAGSLRKLDLDDDEMIGAEELEPFRSPLAAPVQARPDRPAAPIAVPPAVELAPGESSLRVARLLLRKYDKGRGDRPGPPDGKLTRDEFALDPDAFSAADPNRDGALNLDELRRFVDRAPRDLVLDVAFTPDGSGRATCRVGGEAGLPEGFQVRQLAADDFEASLGPIRLDLRIEDGSAAADVARRSLKALFDAADKNRDGYLEAKELVGDRNPAAPLAGLFPCIDRDGDGKLYPEELRTFAEGQAETARGRLVLTASDQGRAVFSILDRDRDRRLGAREVMRAVAHVLSWDRDGDGRVSADEIPYHLQLTLARGAPPGLAGIVGGAPSRPTAPAAGPSWFRRMDRNRDGDLSSREFLGPRDQFDRLDRDGDGLIGPDEAEAATAAAKAPPPVGR